MKKRILTLLLAMSLIAGTVLALEDQPEAGCAPVAQNLELETYRGVEVGGRLEAVDPDGDLSGFEITTPPGKGSIRLETDGSFVYTPAAGKRGRDYFGYKALDAAGNLSQEATVIIKLKKQDQETAYSDMTGNGAHYAAIRLAEEGVFTGKNVAGEAFFEPAALVTREEFLAMSMALTGTELLSGVSRTGFADDEAIAVWAKPYVATALMEGTVSGYTMPGGAQFRPAAAICVYEAAVMLDNMLQLTDVSLTGEDASTPVWAAQSTANLRACRLLDSGVAADSLLTREQSANMLLAAWDFLERR